MHCTKHKRFKESIVWIMTVFRDIFPILQMRTSFENRGSASQENTQKIKRNGHIFDIFGFVTLANNFVSSKSERKH